MWLKVQWFVFNGYVAACDLPLFDCTKTPVMDSNKKTSPGKTEMDADLSPEERSMLDESIENTMLPNDDYLQRPSLDETDEDGEKLNVASFDETGEDLDIPGAELDDDDELLGEEDEENNGYSEADTE